MNCQAMTTILRMGTALFQTEINNALKIHEEHLLKEISDALKRIEDGSYGKCELCQKGSKTKALLYRILGFA